ncbi:MAG: helix-turn-helix transcriptional regulator [Megasphaera cerevisiae]|nr:helix-turn-helix transcriptional regulator [Megasphaera cerevisiae]
MVGLSGDRIRQYENDVRKPKPELLQKIVKALNVDASSLSDIDLTTFDDIMHIFFLLENELGLSINKIHDQYSLTFNNNPPSKDILYALDSWYIAKQTSLRKETDDSETAMKKYNTYREWCYRYTLDKRAYDKLITDNLTNIYKPYLDQPTKINICTFKDIALILENLLRNNINIEFGYIPERQSRHVATIISFDYSQLIALSGTKKQVFTDFLIMLKQLIDKGVEFTENTYTYWGHSLIDFNIYSAPLYSLVKNGLMELQKRLANSTYENDKNFKSTYEEMLTMYDLPIERLQ